MMQDDAILVYGKSSTVSREAALVRMRDLGVKRVRILVAWNQVEVAPGVNDFSLYDPAVDAVRAHGMKVLLTVTGPAPAWHSGDQLSDNFRPDPAAYGALAGAVAAHFAGRVYHFAVWNEPNWPTSLAPQSSAPQQYRALYAAAAPAIRAAVPGAKVLFGELAPAWRHTSKGNVTAPMAFLRAALRVPGSIVTDGVATHPYNFHRAPLAKPDGKDDVTLGGLSRLTKWMSASYHHHRLRTRSGRKPGLYLTEFGILTGGPRRVSLATQAKYLRAALKVACTAKVQSFNLYELVDPTASGLWTSGLLRANGARKPSYATVRAWSHQKRC